MRPAPVSSGATRCHVVCVRGWPCNRTTGGPLPPRRSRNVTFSATGTRLTSKSSNTATSSQFHGNRPDSGTATGGNCTGRRRTRSPHLRTTEQRVRPASTAQNDGSRAPCLAPVTRPACAGTRNDGHPHGRGARQLLPGGERWQPGTGQALPGANNHPAGSAIGTPVEVSPLAPTKMYTLRDIAE